jgi:phage terminase large subunit-like protein
LHDWDLWGRPEQFEPAGKWQFWLILAGRGWGKTRTGAEWVKKQVKKYPLVNLIAATADDAREIMIDGESGILASCNKLERPKYIQNKNRLEWPNGARSLIFTAEKPERLRGKQHMCIWADELAAWRYPEAWHQAMFGLRLGDHPRAIITTTPKPTKLIKELAKDALTYITKGTTYDNKDNLAASFLSNIIKTYEGTRLGRQELNAEILDDNPNALFKQSDIDRLRVRAVPCLLKRILVGVDPAVTSKENSDLTGIIVVGLGYDGHGYVLADYSLVASPKSWAEAVIKAYEEYRADMIIAETNNGGDLVEANIRTIKQDFRYKKVHASKGKVVRAEPVAGLYEQGKIHHVGYFANLEDQMCDFNPQIDPEKSPDRLDALVWAFWELFNLGEIYTKGFIDYYSQLASETEKQNECQKSA